MNNKSISPSVVARQIVSAAQKQEVSLDHTNLLKKITMRLTGMNVIDLTTAERQIVTLLVCNGFILIDDYGDLYAIDPSPDRRRKKTHESTLNNIWQNLDEATSEVYELFERHGLSAILRDDYKGDTADIQKLLADCDKSIAFEMLFLLVDITNTTTAIINDCGEHIES